MFVKSDEKKKKEEELKKAQEEAEKLGERAPEEDAEKMTTVRDAVEYLRTHVKQEA